jgi:choline dehydrogenase-like flavoprotein
VTLPKRIETADAVVIGSGAGGGPLALELVRHGLRVILLEEGDFVSSRRFSQRDRDMVDLLYRNRGLQTTSDLSVTVLQGVCVGGSTVINMGDVVLTPEPIFRYWQKHFSLEGISYPEFVRHAITARRIISAGPIEEREINENNRLLLETARKKGYRAGVFEDNRIHCTGSGYCLLGCSYDAKRSVLVTYIPMALEKGLRLLPRHKALRVAFKGDSVSHVEAVELARDRKTILGPVEIRAPFVFLCAGTIHTPQILKRSGVGGPHAGKHLSLQPQTAVFARFPRRLISYRGIPQSVYVDQFEVIDEDRGFSGFRIEGIYASPGLASMYLTGIGDDLLHLLRHYDSMSACLVLVPDHPAGEVRLTPQGYEIRYRLEEDVLARLKEGVRVACELYLEGGAEEVYLPVEGVPPVRSQKELSEVIERVRFRPLSARLLSAHPQGTARMSDTSRLGVVNSRFAVYKTKGLYVCDGSIFPTTSSSHTMLPILAMAHLCAERFLNDHGITYQPFFP